MQIHRKLHTGMTSATLSVHPYHVHERHQEPSLCVDQSGNMVVTLIVVASHLASLITRMLAIAVHSEGSLGHTPRPSSDFYQGHVT